MNLNLGELFYSEMVEVYSALAVGLLPIFFWILIPAMILNRLIGNKEGWHLGALLGFVAYIESCPCEQNNSKYTTNLHVESAKTRNGTDFFSIFMANRK